MWKHKPKPLPRWISHTWSQRTVTGYIMTNPETGAGVYMISGGLNGGSSSFIVYLKYLAGVISEVGNILLMVDSRLEQQIENEAFWSTTSLLLNLVLMYFLWAVFDSPVPEEPVDEFGRYGYIVPQ